MTTSTTSSSLRSELRALWKARSLAGLKGSELVVPVLTGVATMLSSVALTVVSAWLITKAWQKPQVYEVAVAVTSVRLFGISRALFRYFERLASHKLALLSAGRTRENAYRTFTDADPQRILSLSRGALLTRLGADIDEVAQVIVRVIVPVGTALVTSFCAIVFALVLSPAAGLLLFLGLLAAAVIPPLCASRAVRLTEKDRAAAMQNYAGNVDSILSYSASLRVENEMDRALANAKDASLKQLTATEKGAAYNAWAKASTSLSHGLTVLGMLVLAGWMYLAEPGAHSPQWMGILVLLALASFEAVSLLPDAATTVTRASDAAVRLNELVDTPEHEETGSLTVSAQPHLRAENLVVGFDSDVATWDLDLPWLTRREIVAPSGYGKTTLLLTLAGLLPPRGGAATIDGHRVAEYTEASLRRGITLSLEDAHIFATTVRDNMLLGAASATNEELHEVIDAVGLSAWVADLPHGLNTVLTSGDQSLSGGQRRRLLLARALLTDSPVLLLDEPTEHLDPRAEEELTSMLLGGADLPGARPQRTVVVVRHPRED